MSHPTGGERAYHDALAPDESGAASSLSSTLNLYNSELAASSSQPVAENTLYREGDRYSLPHEHHHGSQQEQLHYEPDQLLTQSTVPTSLPRSNPIAIIRATGDTKREVDESDFDDDDSEIDVEGDAIKLQRKYGNKVIQSYIQDSTIMKSSEPRIRNKSSSVLNAPYLGSLSKSSNQVLSLPPISLAGDSAYLGEPPESIVSYGSLRDSHERGRFLDGPSSYREPMSGKIRQLDHRLRYHGRQPELNIGERLQQSRKLKELRLEKERKKKQEESNGSAGNDDGERKETTSSLSAMMRDASQNVDRGGVDNNLVEDNSFLGTERLIPIQSENITSSYNNHDYGSSMNLSHRSMLSTSMTAFELLKSSNIADPSYSATRANDTHQTTTMDFRNSSGFQPLARSMSDPTPRFQNLSLSSDIPVNSGLPPATQTVGGLSAQMMENHHTTLQNSKNNYVLANNNNTHFASPTSMIPPDQVLMLNGMGHRSPHNDHDPNTDGAFGDMDL